MDDVTMKLPLRLVPGKGGAIVLGFFFLLAAVAKRSSVIERQ